MQKPLFGDSDLNILRSHSVVWKLMTVIGLYRILECEIVDLLQNSFDLRGALTVTAGSLRALCSSKRKL